MPIFMLFRMLELKKVTARDNCEQLTNLEDWFYWLSTSHFYRIHYYNMHALFIQYTTRNWSTLYMSVCKIIIVLCHAYLHEMSFPVDFMRFKNYTLTNTPTKLMYTEPAIIIYRPQHIFGRAYLRDHKGYDHRSCAST